MSQVDAGGVAKRVIMNSLHSGWGVSPAPSITVDIQHLCFFLNQ